jgi:TPR repeat protein
MKTISLALILASCLTVLLPNQAVAETSSIQNYDLGLDSAEDHRYSAAYSHFLIAAEAGNREAQRTVALMLLYGESVYGPEVKRNREQAVHWFKVAAQNGCQTSAYMLRKLVS